MRVNRLNLNDVYTALVDAQHYDALWNRFIDFLTASDVDVISYHYISSLTALNKDRVDVLLHGFPTAWNNYYREKELHKHDPIYNISYRVLRPIKWSDVANRPDLTQEEKSFISELKQWMKGDGYSIPAFGPSGQNACFGIGNSATIAEWDFTALRRIEWICWQFHLSYCALRLKEFPETFSLTDQDREILQQWGRGVNISTIANNINEDAKTVQMALNSIMEKMKVIDSQSLMIRAAHLGLIKLKT